MPTRFVNQRSDAPLSLPSHHLTFLSSSPPLFQNTVFRTNHKTEDLKHKMNWDQQVREILLLLQSHFPPMILSTLMVGEAVGHE